MPRTRSLKWSELKIGIMAVVALLIAAALILALGGEGGFFWQRYNLKVKFANAGGVQRGSPVRVAGVTVGAVVDIRFVGSEVEMVLELREDMQERVRTPSRATIGSVSLLGEGAVDINATTTGQPIPEWGYVPSDPPPPQLSDVTAAANKGITELTALITDIRAGKGTVGKLMTDEQLYADLQQFTTAASGSHRRAVERQGHSWPAAEQPRKRAAAGKLPEKPHCHHQQDQRGAGQHRSADERSRPGKEPHRRHRQLQSISSRLNEGRGHDGPADEQ